MTDTKPITALALPKMNLPDPVEVRKDLQTAFSNIYESVEKRIAEHEIDLTTDKGRKAIASLAHSVSTEKVDLVKRAKELTEEQAVIVKTVTSERTAMERRMDELRDAARKPLTDWEAAEAKRKADYEEAIAAIDARNTFTFESTADEIRAVWDGITAKYKDFDWGDFADDAAVSVDMAKDYYALAISAAEKREADAKELAELREVQAKRDAEDAERAEKEAAERAEVERKEQAEADRIAAEKAHAARLEREADEKAQREQEAKEAAEAAAAEAIREANERAEQAERNAAAAVIAEQERVAKEKAKQQAEADAKAADKEHRASINNAALKTLMQYSGVSEDVGKSVLKAIARREVDHVTINY